MDYLRNLALMVRLSAVPLLFVAALAGASPAPGAERIEEIPAAFHGLWMAEPRHCRAKATDESWLRIEAGRINFYESSGPVLAVVRRGTGEIGLISELSGEGSTWLHLVRLRLDAAGNRLALETLGVAGETTRVRCPEP